MIDHIISECSTVDTEKLYDDMLDECSETCNTCKQFGASRILKEMDPTAYRCGMLDFLDGETRDRDGLIEIGSDYYQMREVSKAQEEFIDERRDELGELETELGELETESDEDETDKSQSLLNSIDKAKDAIARKESLIEACEDYAF